MLLKSAASYWPSTILWTWVAFPPSIFVEIRIKEYQNVVCFNQKYRLTDDVSQSQWDRWVWRRENRCSTHDDARKLLKVIANWLRFLPCDSYATGPSCVFGSLIRDDAPKNQLLHTKNNVPLLRLAYMQIPFPLPSHSKCERLSAAYWKHCFSSSPPSPAAAYKYSPRLPPTWAASFSSFSLSAAPKPMVLTRSPSPLFSNLSHKFFISWTPDSLSNTTPSDMKIRSGGWCMQIHSVRVICTPRRRIYISYTYLIIQFRYILLP